MPSSKHHKRYRKSSSSSSEEPQPLRKRHISPEKVYCKAIAETLDFSALIGGTTPIPPATGTIPSCTPHFLHDGFGFQTPGTETQIIINDPAAFDLEQVVTADCTCVHIGWHLEKGALAACERYTITVAKVNLCGAAGASIEPVATVAIPTTGGLDLCGRKTGQSAVLVGSQTVPGKFKKGELIAAYFTILEPEPCPVECTPCPAPTPPPSRPGPGKVGLNIVLA